MAQDDAARQLSSMQEMARLQARVCYMNVDRTLATWTRTALALMVFGIAMDRFGLLLLSPHPIHVGTRLAPNPLSSIGGIILIALGVFIALSAALRHRAHAITWSRQYGRDATFGPWLAFPFAMMVTALGIGMLTALLVFVK